MRLLFTGDHQVGVAGLPLHGSYYVTLVDSAGSPMVGDTIVATVQNGDGSVDDWWSLGNPDRVRYMFVTNQQGMGWFMRILGPRVGTQHVVITSPAAPGDSVITTDSAIDGPQRLAWDLRPPATVAAGDLIHVRLMALTARGTLWNLKDTVSLAIASDTTPLHGTTRVVPSGGVVDFPDLSITKVGGYSLIATTPTAIPTVYSNGFAVQPLAAARLEFAQPPANGVVGFPFGVAVESRDRYGNVATGLDSVHVTLTANPGGAILTGMTSRAAVAGVATLTLLLDKISSGYVLAVSATGVPTLTSAPFAMSAGDGRYHLIDLGTLGGNSSAATAINDSGIVVGNSIAADGSLHGFRWDGALHDLGPIRPTAIGQGGQIAGSDSTGYAVLWNHGSIHRLLPVGFSWPGTAIHVGPTGDATIQFPGDEMEARASWFDASGAEHVVGTKSYTIAAGANDAGVIVGSFAFREYEGEPESSPFVWRNGVMTVLPNLTGDCQLPSDQPCPQAAATAVNGAGLVVGYANDSISGTSAVAWQNDSISVLGVYPRHSTMAGFVDEVGRIAGYVDLYATNQRAWILDHGITTDLGSLGGGQTVISALVDGVVVGSSLRAPGVRHAFVWKAGVMTELAGNLGEQCHASGINAGGDVIGWCTGATGSWYWDQPPWGGFPPHNLPPWHAVVWRIAR